MSNTSRPWDEPWSTERIVENATNWTLAGDAALLKTLESFAENLFAKVGETNDNLNKLLDNLDDVSLRLDVVRNEFFGLQNKQFIESRVYEDDETAEEKENNEKKTEVPEKTDTSKSIIGSILKSIDVIDEFYEQVEVSVSDSEEEDSEITPNYVLRAKDPYSDRPLPHVIGTEAWHKKWHVGLKDSSSDEEAEKLSEKFSESDSESDLPVSNRINLRDPSETSSEAELKVNTMRFDGSSKDFGSSESEQDGSVPTQAPVSNKSFAEQLAAKLGDMIEAQIEDNEEEINRRPIQKEISQNKFRNVVLPDEPPPLEEDDDIFDRKRRNDIFAGNTGFLDEDDEDFWGNDRKTQNNKTTDTNKNKNIFDEEYSDDEDGLFTTTNKPETTTITKTEIPKKKPIGGVALPAAAAISALPAAKQVAPSIRKDEPNKPETPVKQKKVGLFDDLDDDPFDDIFSNVTSEKFTSGLFDDVIKGEKNLFDDDDGVDDLLINTKKEESDHKRQMQRPIFQETNEDPIFKIGNEGNQQSENSLFESKLETKGLFDSSDDIFNLSKSEESKPPIDIPTEETDKQKTEKKSKLDSIFASNENLLFETEDLFTEPTEKLDSSIESSSRSAPEPTTIERIVIDEPDFKPEVKTEHSPNIPLFDPTPPPFTDDDWDVKSEQNLFEDDEQSYDGIFSSVKTSTSLFDDEPPSLVDEKSDESIDSEQLLKCEDSISVETTATKIDAENNKPESMLTANKKGTPGKLKLSLNINVGALLPGSTPAPWKAIKKPTEPEKPEEPETKSPTTPFDEATADVVVLACATKDRARITTKRRPSTRRGRMQQLTKSEDVAISNEIASETLEEEINTDDTAPKSTSTPVSSVDLFGDENSSEDIFFASTKKQDSKKKVNRSLFDSPDLDDDDVLFKTTTKEPKPVSKVVTADLFAEDDGLFGKRKTKKESVPMKKGLFDDDDDDDDGGLFGGGGGGDWSRASESSAVERNRVKVSTVKKLEPTQMTEDPLDALKK